MDAEIYTDTSVRPTDLEQLAGWCAELAELVAEALNDSDPQRSDRAGELADRIQHVADVSIRRRKQLVT